MYIYKGIVICLILQFTYAKKTISEQETANKIVIKEGIKYCENATGVTESQAAIAAVELVLNKTNTIITQEMKCFWECFFKKIGWMDDNGNINEKPVKLTPTPCYAKYGLPCLNVTGTDTCDKAAKFQTCFDKTYMDARSEGDYLCYE